MYAGGYAGESGFIYIAYNLYWTEQTFALPLLAEHASWYRVMDTSEPESFLAAAGSTWKDPFLPRAAENDYDIRR